MPAGTDILLMDQDSPERRAVERYLSRHGFRVAVADGDGMLRAAIRRRKPTVLLLGVDPSRTHGLASLATAREVHHGGVILLMPSTGSEGRIDGLDMGADDCVDRPFDYRELLARVRSVHRRYEGQRQCPQGDAEKALPIGTMRLHVGARRLVTGNGGEVALTRLEFDLLSVLASRPRQVMSREQLSRMARKRDWHPDDRSIDVRIAGLRRKLEPDPGRPEYIKTVRGRGYIFIPGSR